MCVFPVFFVLIQLSPHDAYNPSLSYYLGISILRVNYSCVLLFLHLFPPDAGRPRGNDQANFPRSKE